MILNNNGNLGLGVTSPLARLHVDGGFRHSSVGEINIDAPFVLGGRMKILENGNVGIGTTSNLDSKLNFNASNGDRTVDVKIVRFNLQAQGIRSQVIGNNSSLPAIYGIVGLADNYTGIAGNGIGVYGSAPHHNGATQWAGYFNGNCSVTGVFQNSDKRLKEEIRDISQSLNLLLKIRPKEYKFKSIEGVNLPLGNQFGIIADEIEEYFPELVLKSPIHSPESDRSDSGEYLFVNYTGFIPHLIKAVQEQQVIIGELNEKLNYLHEQLKDVVPSIGEFAEDSETIKLSPHIITIRPNPARSESRVTLYIPEDFLGVELFVHNGQGKVVSRQTVYNKDSDITLSTHYFDSGLYIISIRKGEVVFDTRRLIITK